MAAAGTATEVEDVEGGWSQEISSLDNGTAYQVQVRASNAADPSDWTAVSADTTGTPLAMPGMPTSLVVTRGDSGELAVAWTAPAEDGGEIASYDVRYCTPDATDLNDQCQDAGADADTLANGWVAACWHCRGRHGSAEGNWSLDITGLTNGATYQVWVRAVNEAEAGPSPWAKATGTPLAAPGEPTGVAVEAGDGSLTVTWVAPQQDGGGIASYDVRYCTPHATDQALDCEPADADTGTEGWMAAAGTATEVEDMEGSWSLDISSLDNGTAYQVQVRAVNAADPSAWTAAVSGTPLAMPGMPTGLAVEMGVASLTVTWTAPAEDGGEVASYDVRYCTPDATDLNDQCQDAGADADPFVAG